jgi:hypothetical protein
VGRRQCLLNGLLSVKYDFCYEWRFRAQIMRPGSQVACGFRQPRFGLGH